MAFRRLLPMFVLCLMGLLSIAYALRPQGGASARPKQIAFADRGEMHKKGEADAAEKPEKAGGKPKHADHSGVLICIDPGHSKQTVGATANGLKEYVVCWKMALKLQAALQEQGVEALLTKQTQDANVSNVARANFANSHNADLMIRLHCDSGGDAGIATFYPATQGEIRGKRGPDADVIRQSGRCARAFHAATVRALKTYGSPLHDRGVRTDAQTYVGGKLGGALEGSIYSERPVILIEMCVLDDARDAAFIRNGENQTHLARAMAAGALSAVAANRKSR